MALMAINLTSVKSVGDYAQEVHIFRLQYDRAILTRLRANVSPNSYRACRAMGRVFAPSQIQRGRRIVESAHTPTLRTRSVVRSDAIRRSLRDPNTRSSGNRLGAIRPSAGSPRDRMISGPEKKKIDCPTPVRPIIDRPNLAHFAPNDGERPANGGEIALTRPKSPPRSGDGKTRDPSIGDNIWDLANGFAGISTLIETTNDANFSRESAAVLVTEALMSRRHLVSSAKTVAIRFAPTFAAFTICEPRQRMPPFRAQDP